MAENSVANWRSFNSVGSELLDLKDPGSSNVCDGFLSDNSQKEHRSVASASCLSERHTNNPQDLGRTSGMSCRLIVYLMFFFIFAIAAAVFASVARIGNDLRSMGYLHMQTKAWYSFALIIQAMVYQLVQQLEFRSSLLRRFENKLHRISVTNLGSSDAKHVVVFVAKSVMSATCGFAMWKRRRKQASASEDQETGTDWKWESSEIRCRITCTYLFCFV